MLKVDKGQIDQTHKMKLETRTEYCMVKQLIYLTCTISNHLVYLMRKRGIHEESCHCARHCSAVYNWPISISGHHLIRRDEIKPC